VVSAGDSRVAILIVRSREDVTLRREVERVLGRGG
jgi:hypothetical protein